MKEWLSFIIKFAIIGVIFALIIHFISIKERMGTYTNIQGIPFYISDNMDKKVIETMNFLLEAKDDFFRQLTENFSPARCKKVIYLESDSEPIFIKINRMKERFQPKYIREIIPGNYLGDTSYVINKGETMGFCLKNTPKSPVHERDILMFVFIHELSHCMTNEYGHTTKFWKNMAFLLEQAELYGIISNKNYYRNPREYCSMKVTHNPLYV